MLLRDPSSASVALLYRAPALALLVVLAPVTAHVGCVGDAFGPPVGVGVPFPSGIDSDAEGQGLVHSYCEDPTQFEWAVDRGVGPAAFPDDMYRLADSSKATGWRVLAGSAPWPAGQPKLFRRIYDAMDALDGFGTTAGVMLRFAGGGLMEDAVPSGEASAAVSSPLRMLELPVGAAGTDGAAGPAKAIPFEARLQDDGASVVLWPMVPLRPGTRHAVVATRGLRAADGGCVSPSFGLRFVLEEVPHDARTQRVQQGLRDVMAAEGLEPGDVSAAVVFTTQTIATESLAVRDDVRAVGAGPAGARWAGPLACEDDAEAGLRVCDGAFVARNYRDAAGVYAGGAATEYEVPARVWLPLGAAGPAPVVLFGHGLEHDRAAAGPAAAMAGALGMATVAIDGPAHGAHPDALEDGAALATIGFFEVDLEALTFDGPALRDNLRQATWDKLSLLELLRSDGDVDGNGVVDLDMERLVYMGESFGGMMGPEPVALDGGFDAMVLWVPGGRVATIVQDAPRFRLVIEAMMPKEATDGDIDRIFPAIQTLLERGDPSNYAPHLLGEALPGGRGERAHVLMTVAMGDTTVPGGSSRSLARALGVPHVGAVFEEIGGVPRGGEGAVRGNVTLDDGAVVTAAVVQMDRMTHSEGGEPAAAHHDYLPSSREHRALVEHFLRTWLETGVPEVIDPYAAVGTAPLER